MDFLTEEQVMDEATQKYVEAMQDLFTTEGWTWIETECKGLLEQYGDVDSISTAEQLQFAKGVRFAAGQLLSLPDMIRDIEEEDAED